MSEKTADANIYGGNQQPAQFLTRDAGVLLRVQTLLRWLAVSGQSVAIFVVNFVLEYHSTHACHNSALHCIWRHSEKGEV